MSTSSKVSQISPCPACQNVFFKKIFTKKGKDFWRCQNCGLEKIYPLPSLEDLKDYYDESYSEGMYKLFIEARKMKQLTATERLRQISSYCPKGNWLDVGCSDGVFVEQARLAGMSAEGIDLSEVAIQEARKRDLPVYYSTIDDFKPGYEYNTITAFDVLEHVVDPVVFMKSIQKLLVPGGKIAISVPNQGSLVCKLMGKAWYFYIPEEHLHYFNMSNLTKFLTNMGFIVERCVPAYKPLTYSYSLAQFKEYNPSIYAFLLMISKFIPKKIQNLVLPLYIGEIMIIARV